MPNDTEDKRPKVRVHVGGGRVESFNANPAENSFTEAIMEKKKLGFTDGSNAEKLYQERKKLGYDN